MAVTRGVEVEAYTDFIKEAEGLKSTLRTAWTAEGRQESTAEHSWRLALFAGVMCREFPELGQGESTDDVPCSRPGGTVQRRHIGSIAAGCR